MGLDYDPLKLSELMLYLRATFLKYGFLEAYFFRMRSHISSKLAGVLKCASQGLIMQDINHNFSPCLIVALTMHEIYIFHTFPKSHEQVVE